MMTITNTLFRNSIKILPSSSSSSLQSHYFTPLTLSQFPKTPFHQFNGFSSKLCFSHSQTSTIPTFTTSSSDSETKQQQQDDDDDDEVTNSIFSINSSSNGGLGLAPPLKKKKRYRKEYPGESKGITEEMRFVAMRLHNDNGSSSSSSNGADFDGVWVPSIEGFLKYLVDTKLVFQTIEGLVEDSNDVSYAYFRKTGLERSGSLARDLERFSQEGMEIPEPSNPGVSYASYLKKLSEKSAPLFLSHFYNIYFSHLAGGQVIAKQVAEKLVVGRKLDFFSWDGDEEEFLKEVRDKLNKLSEHWSRDVRNKCLKEAPKSFRYLGQIVRLIIL